MNDEKGPARKGWEYRLQRVFREVMLERERAVQKFGEQAHLPIRPGSIVSRRDLSRAGERLERVARHHLRDDYRHGDPSWLAIIAEEAGEAMQAEDRAALRAELIQLAGVAAHAVVVLDEQDGGS